MPSAAFTSVSADPTAVFEWLPPNPPPFPPPPPSPPSLPPPSPGHDEIVMSVCLGSFVLLLTVIVATRHIPTETETMSGREALRELVAPLAVAAFTAGAAPGWWRAGERASGSSAGARSRLRLAASFLVFWMWFISTDSGTGAGSGSSNFALAIGAGLCALPEAVIVLVGISVGRIPAALVWSFRRVRGRRPAVGSA